jgi:hypothetical protein
MKRIRALPAAAGLALVLALIVAPAPAQAAPKAPVDQGEVVAIVQNPDGTGHMSFWSAPAGMTARSLYARLKAEGVPGLIDPAATSGVASEPVDCPINGAYALGRRCGINRLHWPGSHPRVNFVDFTSSAWPVTTTVGVWNQSSAIDSIYHWYSTYGCLSNCVYVYNGDYGATGWVGHSNVYWTGTTITSATIQLNDHCAAGYICGDVKWHRETTCHEEGHALGLDHNLFESSCIYVFHTANRSTTPAGGDYQMLDSIY